jgi:hypothetical protein
MNIGMLTAASTTAIDRPVVGEVVLGASTRVVIAIPLVVID